MKIGDFGERVVAFRSGRCPDCEGESIEHGKCDHDGHYQLGRVCTNCMTWTWYDGVSICTESI